MSPQNEGAAHDVTGGASRVRAAACRATGFAAFWLILTGAGLADLAAGAVAVAASTWTSLRLMPPGGARLHPLQLAGFALRFFGQSVIAGIDVAGRALDPRLPLRPGFIAYRPLLPPGTGADAFCAVTSLLPGTLPSGPSADGGVLVHCLDLGQPVATQLAAEEARFARMLGAMQHDD